VSDDLDFNFVGRMILIMGSEKKNEEKDVSCA
jgi:hypothetical protein